MAESKQYITQAQESGNVMISEDVIITIASRAISEVEGIAGPGKKAWNKSIRIQVNQKNYLNIGCSVLVDYGTSVVEIANAAQSAVANAVNSMTGIKVNIVNISVSGIVRK